MKYAHAIFLGATCLFISGCSEAGKPGVGPAGVSAPFERSPLKPPHERSQSLFARGPGRRARFNAERGRPVRPDENTSCLASATGGPCCDFPFWLNEALKFNRLYAGYDPREISSSATPRLFDHPHCNAYGENFALVQMWDHLSTALQRQKQNKAYDRGAPWSGVFAHWCLTRAINPKTGTAFAGVAGDPWIAENWLDYGTGCDPCLGALMVARKDGSPHIAFCVGAILMPVNADDKVEAYERFYLGLGGDQNSRVGISALAAADIRAFRLPHGYQPCREHFKLDYSFWVEQYRHGTGDTAVAVVA